MQSQGAKNRIHKIQIYANKFVVCAKFQEAIQNFKPVYVYFLSFTLTLLSSFGEFFVFVDLNLDLGVYNV